MSFQFKVGLKKLIQIIGYNFKLTIILKAKCKIYIEKTHLLHFVLLFKSYKNQKKPIKPTKHQFRD